MKNDDVRIKLLELQVAALRSVLSEFDGDKSEYTQMIAADAFAAALLNIKPEVSSGFKPFSRCIVRFDDVDLDTHQAYDPGIKRYTAYKAGTVDVKIYGDHTPPNLNNFRPLAVYNKDERQNITVYRVYMAAGDCIDFPVDAKTFTAELF